MIITYISCGISLKKQTGMKYKLVKMVNYMYDTFTTKLKNIQFNLSCYCH